MLVCIDYENTLRNCWQKDWLSLGASVKVVELDELWDMDLSTVVLLLLHESCLVPFNEHFPGVKRDLLERMRGCIGVVSAGRLERKVTDEGRVCIVGTRFPTLPEQLKPLKAKVDQLLTDLSQALEITHPEDRQNALVRAWRRFDQEQQGVDTVAVVAILCQGYLAVNARSENDEWDPPEIRPALEQMGWPEAMADEAVRGLLRDDLQAQRDVVAKADWWLDVFDLESDVAVQVNTLQDQLKEEWNEGTDTQLPDEITQLLDALADGTLKAPGVVACAYCKIAEKLGGLPCRS